MKRIGCIGMIGLTVGLGAAGGCATVPSDAGFDKVGQDVTERTGQQVFWRRGTEEDAQVDAQIAQLLNEPLTADTAAQIALLNNRRLQATYEELMVAQADLVQAGLLRNPVFDVEARFADAGTGWELTLVQDFLDVFQIPLRKRIAGANFESAKRRVALEVIDMARRVRNDAVQLSVAIQTTANQRVIVQSHEAALDLARDQHAAGNITDLELSMRRGEVARARLNLAAAEAQQTALREQLNVSMGLWGSDAERWGIVEDTTVATARPASQVPPDELVRRALEQSLALEARRYELLALAERLGMKRDYALLGELEAGVKAEREPDGGDWVLGPVLSLPLPLFDQGQAAVAGAEAEFRRAQSEVYATAVEVRAAVRAAYAQLLTAEAKEKYLEQVVLPLRQEALDQALRQYNAMQIGAFDLFEFRRSQLEAQQEHLAAWAELCRVRGDLQTLLDGGSAVFRSADSAMSTADAAPDAGGH